MKSLNKKNVVITGSASGLGKEMAKAFAQEKSNLALIDINEKALNITEGELAKYGVNVKAYKCDISANKQIEKTGEKIKKDFGKIDVVINNAGVISGKFINELTYEDIKKTIDINLVGVMMMTKQFLQEMIDRKEGHIVNISSAAGLIGNPKMGDYCASKFGVIGFSDSLRLELKKIGCGKVKVTIVCPSLISTGMFEGFKSPILNPVLDPKDLAEQIVKAVKKDKPYLKLPFMVKAVNLLKIPPVSFLDRVADIIGVTRSMDDFVGRR